MSRTQIIPLVHGEAELIPALPRIPARTSISVTVWEMFGFHVTWTEYRLTTYTIASCQSVRYGLNFARRGRLGALLALCLILLLVALTAWQLLAPKLVPGAPAVGVSVPLGPVQEVHQAALSLPLRSIGERHSTASTNPIAPDAAPTFMMLPVQPAVSRQSLASNRPVAPSHDAPSPAMASLAPAVEAAPAALPPIESVAAPMQLSFDAAVKKALESQDIVTWQAEGVVGYVTAGPVETNNGVRCRSVTYWERGGAQGAAQTSVRCGHTGLKVAKDTHGP